ncbi:PREDICTED: uncharacterized protein LOC104815098 [Tarenaya hassleriana]|uniref:uncharacterized protein LOC104815098 n=1 Tax=Tarenaya hassleriana TaxID=28532 RepID=UPI00053CA8C7|nr:PREDICTED: uncharacterized protein LOC104815098 [Tarenaya hassleriana]
MYTYILYIHTYTHSERESEVTSEKTMELDNFPSAELYGATISSEKRRLREPSSAAAPAAEMSLLRWDAKQPDEDDDDPKGNVVPKACSISCYPTKKKLAGWPPVKRWRKKSIWKSRFNRTVDNVCIACRRRTSYDRTVKNQGILSEVLDV